MPLLLAPAMNREMWAHPATQRNLAQLRADGTVVLGVGSGEQACGETGDGRMLEPDELLYEVVRHFQPQVLAGRRVLVPDLPGFGDSALPPSGADADAMPVPLEQGLAHLLGDAACDVTGFSFGGMTAGLLASEFPARVATLVLIGTPGMGLQALAQQAY